jgi:hypothetical protein
MNDLTLIFNKFSHRYIADYLDVSTGTVKRWSESKKIPHQYIFELMKLDNIPINYSEFCYKLKDQFFTPKNTAVYCYSKSVEIINKHKDPIENYTFIEPSAGDGAFLSILPENRIAFDIEPRHIEIKRQDYLTWKPTDNKKYIVIGNPPFGLRGHMALKFINHSSIFADYVCFILPQLFASDGKGVPRKRVKNLNLIYSENLITSNFYLPDGKPISVKCIFQIWSKKHINNEYIISNDINNDIKIYSLSDGGTPSSTRNKKMFNRCHIYLPSTCFGKENMKCYDNFNHLPSKRGYGIVFLNEKEKRLSNFKKIYWSDIAFLSTNSAYNIRSSQILNAIKEPMS